MLKNRFGSWTHGHGPMALGAWAAAARPPGRRAAAAGEVCGGRAQEDKGLIWASV